MFVFVCVFVGLFVRPRGRLIVWRFACLIVCLSVCIFVIVCLRVCLFASLFVCLFACLRLPVCAFIHVSV